MLCVPGSSEVLRMATPADSPAVPRSFGPSLKSTVPVADEGVTVALKVNLVPSGVVSLCAVNTMELACTVVGVWLVDDVVAGASGSGPGTIPRQPAKMEVETHRINACRSTCLI